MVLKVHYQNLQSNENNMEIKIEQLLDRADKIQEDSHKTVEFI
jgi:hypothetical protein